MCRGFIRIPPPYVWTFIGTLFAAMFSAAITSSLVSAAVPPRTHILGGGHTYQTPAHTYLREKYTYIDPIYTYLGEKCTYIRVHIRHSVCIHRDALRRHVLGRYHLLSRVRRGTYMWRLCTYITPKIRICRIHIRICPLKICMYRGLKRVSPPNIRIRGLYIGTLFAAMFSAAITSSLVSAAVIYAHL